MKALALVLLAVVIVAFLGLSLKSCIESLFQRTDQARSFALTVLPKLASHWSPADIAQYSTPDYRRELLLTGEKTFATYSILGDLKSASPCGPASASSDNGAISAELTCDEEFSHGNAAVNLSLQLLGSDQWAISGLTITLR